MPCLYIISYARSLKVKSLAVQDIINRWKALNKILADEVIGRLSKVEYALPNGAMSDLRHLLAESQRLQNQAVRPLQSAVCPQTWVCNIGRHIEWQWERPSENGFSDGLKYSISTEGQSMTPQEQKNRLNDIMFHAQRCELYDDEHRLYAKMGLGITIYFYGGGSESEQRKVLDVFKRYQEQ